MATTQWSQVLAARDGSDTEARAALESLCETYWEPLYAFVRHQGSSPDEANDLTQAYFAELLEKEFLSAVDPAKGRFRSFLLTSLKNFLSHERDRESALKRGGGTSTVSLDSEEAENRFHIESAEEDAPDVLYERRWAMTLMERAMGRLETETRRLFKDSVEVLLSRSEFDLLRIFATHPHHVLSRDSIMQNLRGFERDPFDRSVDVRVTRLRHKIEEDPAAPAYIRTAWGVGYRFTPEGHEL